MRHAKPRKPRPLPTIPDNTSALPLRSAPGWRPSPRDMGGVVYTGGVEVEAETDPNHRAARVPSYSSSTIPDEVAWLRPGRDTEGRFNGRWA